MQLLFDFLPVIAFFVAYKLADIYVATVVIIVAIAAAGVDPLAPQAPPEPDASGYRRVWCSYSAA